MTELANTSISPCVAPVLGSGGVSTRTRSFGRLWTLPSPKGAGAFEESPAQGPGDARSLPSGQALETMRAFVPRKNS